MGQWQDVGTPERLQALEPVRGLAEISGFNRLWGSCVCRSVFRR